MTVEKLRQPAGYQHQPYTYSLYLSAKAGCGRCSLFWRAFTAPDYLLQNEYVTLQRPSALGHSSVRAFLKGSEPGIEQLILTCSYPCLMRDSYFILDYPEDFRKHRHVVNLGVYEPGDDLEAWHTDHARSVKASHPLEREGLNFIHNCLNECEQEHANCRRCQKRLPKRVIDVGPSDGSVVPRLYLSKGETANYIALSYCWGTQPTVTTTSKTMQKRIARMPIETLPRTYVDAIKITRDLGIRYLWIDALCTVQDCREDWRE